jgi:Ca2+-binding EF-hand superfamily protein
MAPEEWLELLATVPKLDEALKADYTKDRVRFKTFRSCGQQLSKLLGNLDRLRLKEKAGEDVSAEIASRKAQAKKLRCNGIFPSPGICVFNQIDMDKSGTISSDELKRMLFGLRKVYPVGEDEINKMIETMDSDSSGEIDELEWLHNLASLPALKNALQKDLDPDMGRLRSYRSPEDQLAKLLGNIMRLEYDIAQGDASKQDELDSRKAQAAKMREKGYVPSAGVVVFNQIDKKKTRQISKEGLQEVLTALKVEGKTVDECMQRLDIDEDGFVSETEWLEGLGRLQQLQAALEADIDPDTGKLKSYA